MIGAGPFAPGFSVLAAKHGSRGDMKKSTLATLTLAVLLAAIAGAGAAHAQSATTTGAERPAVTPAQPAPAPPPPAPPILPSRAIATPDTLSTDEVVAAAADAAGNAEYSPPQDAESGYSPPQDVESGYSPPHD